MAQRCHPTNYEFTARQTSAFSVTLHSMGKEIDFDFITDEKLRSGLQADYREMTICATNEAWKAVYVLAGSLVEAILVDYLQNSGNTDPDPLKMTLGELIVAAKDAGAVSPKTAELSAAIKEFRNLIHPGRIVRFEERVDADGGVVAEALVSMVVREVSSKQEQVHGLSAEQIVKKFESDATALGIASHVLGGAAPREVERVLIKVLPERYFEVAEQPEPDSTQLEGYGRLFRTAFEYASTETQKAVTARYVEIVRTEPGPLVLTYEEQFFRASDLQYVSGAKDRKMLIAHLLARVKDAPTASLFAAMEGIGPFVTAADITEYADRLVSPAVHKPDTAVARAAERRLITERKGLSATVDSGVVLRFAAWRDMFEKQKNEDRARRVDQLAEAYSADSPAP
jgi:hypothetical protein